MWPPSRGARASSGSRLHLDGARLWNASAATGVALSDLAAPFDTVTVCFSKGLGAPIGSALAGTRAQMEDARRLRKMLGAGMRQAGIIAAAAVYAIAHHRARLAEDHEHARLFYAKIRDGVDAPAVSVAPPETNIVSIDLPAKAAEQAMARAKADGLLISAIVPTRLRAVFHLDVSRKETETAAETLIRAIRAACAEVSRRPAGALLLAACAPGPSAAYRVAKGSGDRAYSSGRYAEAASAYADATRAADRPRDAAESLYLEASAHQRSGDQDRARAAYERLIAEQPESHFARRAKFDLADLEIESGNIDKGYDAVSTAGDDASPTTGSPGGRWIVTCGTSSRRAETPRAGSSRSCPKSPRLSSTRPPGTRWPATSKDPATCRVRAMPT